MSDETSARYDEIADFYDSVVGDTVADPASTGLLSLVGEVRGMRLLDLACGQGRIARVLARRGAQIVGADISDALLDKARAAEKDHQLGITYVHADVTASNTLNGEIFDGVVCNHGLSDIDDLDGALATIARVLPPSGWFVFSILHPCFPGWGADAPSSWPPGGGYYQERWWLARSPGFRGKVGANHRMISAYLNMLARSGFIVDRALEPDPGPEWAARVPGADAIRTYLAVRCRKL